MKSWEALNRRIVSCNRCPRLREHCLKVAREKKAAYRHETYWGKPAPNFGDPAAGLLLVGLAPAAHGANRTGRLFTGDRSGDWLFRALHKAGFANQPTAVAIGDGLALTNAAITGLCHCAPPLNKPTTGEIAQCHDFLVATWDFVKPRVVLCLGGLAWGEVLREAKRRGIMPKEKPRFGHAAKALFTDGTWLLGSYHPSQQNTFTGRLTEPMFDAVFAEAKRLLSSHKA